MYIGNSAQSQKLMRARVGMQGLTVLAIAAGGAWTFSSAGANKDEDAARERERLGGVEDGYQGNLGKLAAAANATGAAVRRNSGGDGGGDAEELTLTYSSTTGGK